MKKNNPKTLYALPVVDKNVEIESSILRFNPEIKLSWYENQVGALAVFEDYDCIKKICKERGIDEKLIIIIVETNKE